MCSSLLEFVEGFFLVLLLKFRLKYAKSFVNRRIKFEFIKILNSAIPNGAENGAWGGGGASAFSPKCVIEF